MCPSGWQIRRRFRERFVSLDVSSRLDEIRCCCRAMRRMEKEMVFSEQEPGASGALSTGVIGNIGERFARFVSRLSFITGQIGW